MGMDKLMGHDIAFIHIRKNKVELECSCGWLSEEYPDEDSTGETEARREFYKHAGITEQEALGLQGGES